MGRTNWGPIILGGGALVIGAYTFLNWKTICPQVMGAENCSGDSPVSDILDYAGINALPSGQHGNTRYSPPNTAIPIGTTRATIGGKKVVETRTSPSKPLSQNYLNATKRNTARAPTDTIGKKSGGYNCSSAWCKTYPHMCPKCKSSGYTSAGYQSFGTITLRKMSVR